MFFITHIIVQENTEAVDFLYYTYYRTGKHWGGRFFYNTYYRTGKHWGSRLSLQLKKYRTGKHWGSRFSL